MRLGSTRAGRVMDDAERRVTLAKEQFGIRAEGVQVQIDAHSEIQLRVPHEGHQAPKRVGAVLLPVHADHVLATTAEQFVGTHVLDMTAVREIHPVLLL